MLHKPLDVRRSGVSKKTYLAHALQVLLRVRRVYETEPQKVLNFATAIGRNVGIIRTPF